MKTVLKHEATTLPSVIGILCPTCGADDWALAAKSVQPKDESKVKLRCSACEAQRVKPDELLSDAGLHRRAIRFYERQALSLDVKISKALDYLYQYNLADVSPPSALVLADCFGTLCMMREDDERSDDELECAHAHVDAVVALIDALTEEAEFGHGFASDPDLSDALDSFLYQGANKPRHITIAEVSDSLRVAVVVEPQEGGV